MSKWGRNRKLGSLLRESGRGFDNSYSANQSVKYRMLLRHTWRVRNAATSRSMSMHMCTCHSGPFSMGRIESLSPCPRNRECILIVDATVADHNSELIPGSDPAEVNRNIKTIKSYCRKSRPHHSDQNGRNDGIVSSCSKVKWWRDDRALSRSLTTQSSR
jgi:hypothetical protein